MPGIRVCLILACVVVGTLSKPGPETSPTLENAEKTNLFILSDDEVVAAAAFATCEAYKMVPVSIETKKKNTDLTRFMSSRGVSSAWTSGDDFEYGRNDYYWHGIKQRFNATNYKNWLLDAPLEDESCRCVSFVSGVHASCGNQVKCAGWTVEECELPRRVICENPPKDCNCN